MMTGPPRWSSGDRRRWLVASIDPVRPAEITAPIPVAPCAVCVDDDKHVWSEVEAERIGVVVPRRSVCVCDLCGRCDAQVTQVDVDPGSAAMSVSIAGLGSLVDGRRGLAGGPR